MAERNYSDHQKKIIARFYDKREQMDEERLSELVANLYLSTGKKRANYWVTATDAMTRLEVPQSRIDHILKNDDPPIAPDHRSLTFPTHALTCPAVMRSNGNGSNRVLT